MKKKKGSKTDPNIVVEAMKGKCISNSVYNNKRWMDELGFYVPSTVFQSFRNDGRVNMKGSVQ